MEYNAAQRRLNYICRHLLLPHETFNLLEPVLVTGGHLKHGESEPVVIGGMALDITAVPSISANPRTKTPGKVNFVFGGVARNVAECLSKLGPKPFIISAVGHDMAGNLLLEHWKSAGLSTKGVRKQQDIETAVFCNILDVNGELAAAVSSLDSIEKFVAPDWILQFKCNIRSAPLLMVDANLSLPALVTSCQNMFGVFSVAAASKIPVWFEPVSVAKSRRIASVAKYVHFVSPTEDELIAMANAILDRNVYSPIKREDGRNTSIQSLFQMLKAAVSVLLENGIKIVIVTLGSNGVFVCSKGESSFMRMNCDINKFHPSCAPFFDIMTTCFPTNQFIQDKTSPLFAVHFPTVPASVVSLVGAGDCLVGGMLASLCAGLDVMQSAAVGIAVAKAGIESEINVPVTFNLTAIADDTKLVYSSAKVLCH